MADENEKSPLPSDDNVNQHPDGHDLPTLEKTQTSTTDVESSKDEIEPAKRAGPSVFFPEHDEEKAEGGIGGSGGIPLSRTKSAGKEMRRELTRDEKELANAGYEHLNRKDKKSKATDVTKEVESVDIVSDQQP